MTTKRVLTAIGLGVLVSLLVACSDSKTEAKNDDVKAIREIMEKNEAEKAAAIALDKERMAERIRHREAGFGKLEHAAASKPASAASTK